MRKFFRLLIFSFLGILLLITVAFLQIFFSYDLRRFKTVNPQRTAFMDYFLQIEKQRNPRARIDYRFVPLEKIAADLRQAILIAEDDRFYLHPGLDTVEIRKVFERAWRVGRIERGASTVTQQLVKNLFFSPQKSFGRKFQEIVLALKAEMFLSKRRILELYLNVAQFGKLIFGVEAACQHYFGHSAADVTLEEAIRLAAILPNPMKYKVYNERSRLVYRRRLLILSTFRLRGRLIRRDYQHLLDLFTAEYKGNK